MASRKDAVFLSPHKFVGGPGTPGVLVAKRRAPAPAACRRCRAAGRSCSSARRGRAITPSRRSARRRARRRSSSRSAPGWCSRSRRRSAPRRSTGARTPSRGARSRRGGRTRTSGSSATRSSSGSRSCRSASATRAGCCTRTSSSRCSATCSGSRRAADASAPARTSTACTRSTPRGRRRCTPRRVRGRAGAKLAFARISFNYFISEAVFDYIVEAVHLIANEGWKLLPLYRFDATTGLWRHATAPRGCASRRWRDLERRRSAPDGARERARRPARRGAADHRRRPSPRRRRAHRGGGDSTGSAGSRSRTRGQTRARGVTPSPKPPLRAPAV